MFFLHVYVSFLFYNNVTLNDVLSMSVILCPWYMA